jgi:glycosyltransferase involved in cell wall biosynthesis
MKILKVTGGYPPAFAQGGTATAAHSLMKSLKKNGAEVAVLTLNINGKERIQPSGDFTDYEGIPVRYCKGYMHPVPYFSIELKKVLTNIIKQYDIVLLDSNWTGYGLSTGLICRQSNKPYIIYSHGCLAPNRLLISPLRKKLWWKLFDSPLYNKADGVVALTKSEILQLRNLGVKSPITIIPNGVENNFNENDISIDTLKCFNQKLDKDNFFLFLGRLDPIKGIEMLLEAYARLSKSFSTSLPLMVFAGPSHKNYIKNIKKYMTNLGLEEKIIFTGLVKGVEKWALIKFASAFILPSFGEGLPMAALEALSLGTPVILSKTCYLPEITEWGAGLEIDTRVESISDALKWAIENPDQHKKMGFRGINMIKELFSWDKIAQKTYILCEKILKERAP